MPRLATTAADFATAARLLCAFNAEFDDPYPDEKWLAGRLAQLDRGGDTFVALAEDHQVAVGVAVARMRPQFWEDANECYLAELYIVPDHRGRGCGSGLLRFVIDEARSRDATTMDLTTTDHDAQAMALYEHVGFDRNEGKGAGGPTSFYYELEI